MTETEHQILRLKALEFALATETAPSNRDIPAKPENIIVAAKIYYTFLVNAVATTEPQ